MTKEEAYFKMIEGYRITHTSFASDEYLHMNVIAEVPSRYYDIVDELGYNWGNKRAEPWQSRSGGTWESGWSIYAEKP